MSVSTHTFNAAGLLSKWGFGDGDEPDEVMDHQFDRHPAGVPYDRDLPGNWRRDILTPIAQHLLVPALPVPVEFTGDVSTSHNPARVTSIDGHPYSAFSDPKSERHAIRFREVEVTIPVPYLVDVLEGDRSFAGLDRLSGIDLGLLTGAFAAHLSVDEIADLHTGAGLDPDVLAMMAALHG